MIDIKFIRENPEMVKENLKKKFQENKIELIDKIKVLDEDWRKLKYNEDDLRSQRNKISKNVGINMKKGDKKEAEKLKKEAKLIPKKIEKIQEQRKDLQEKINELMRKIPNFIHESVPIGKDEDENIEIKKFGKPIVPDFEVLNHAVLAEKICGVDFDSARETSGNGFYYLTGDLARLHSSILCFARDFMIKNGFEYVIPPFMIRSDIVKGVMSFEEMNSMMYKIENEDLYLIGTSEHSMIGKFINKTINWKKMPVNLTSYSPCFRKEVGAHGIEEKGLYRVHQFEKQEMVVICNPEDSYKWYDKMLKLTVDFFREIKIPVRTLECCSGDLADLKAKSADVEAWSPRQKKYYEVGSCSNLTDAQARRLNIKIEGKEKHSFAHTLNNTVVASPRALIALMENNQQKDGSIKIPKILQPYMGGMKKIEVKK